MEENEKGMCKIDYSNLPPCVQGDVARYIEQGTPPGSFLTAVICNNFLESVLRASRPFNNYEIMDILRFFYTQAPAGCWGSPDKMTAWMEKKRLERVRQKKVDLSFADK